MDPRNAIQRIKTELPNYGYNDYLRQLAVVEREIVGGRALRVAILRSCTIEPIEPILKLRLLIEGFRPSFLIGGYNQYVQEIVGPASPLHEFQPDVIVLMIRLEDVLPDFIDDFAAKSASEWSDRIASKARELGELASRAEKTFGAQVIVQKILPLQNMEPGVYTLKMKVVDKRRNQTLTPSAQFTVN